MSDLKINISFSNDNTQRITATEKRKIKNKFRKKRKRHLGSKETHNKGQSSYDQASTDCPTSTQNKSLPQTRAAASVSRCSSTRTLPSWSFTVINNGSHEKPKQPGNTKSATTTSGSLASISHTSTTTTPGFSVPSSHRSTTTFDSLASSSCTFTPTSGCLTSSSLKSTTTFGLSPSSSCKFTTTFDCSASSSNKPTTMSAAVPAMYLAIDCEMVGTGPKGHISQLARCSIVSYNGDIVYDKFIKPTVPVTDYRTRWSGIRRSDLVNAMPYPQARKEILRLLNGKVVIGHAIHNDFKVLSYSHPGALTRDTSRIPLLNRKAGFADNECASLKRLTKAIFNRDIQTGRKGHSSVEDAKATMELYKVVEQEWERSLASKSPAC